MTPTDQPTPPAENSPLGSAGEAEVSRLELDELKTRAPDDVARLVERLTSAPVVAGRLAVAVAFHIRDQAASLITTQAQRIEELTAERDQAKGWIKWLVRQATAPDLSDTERLGRVEHFPCDDYPEHPAEARILSLEAEVKRTRDALSERQLIVAAREIVKRRGKYRYAYTDERAFKIVLDVLADFAALQPQEGKDA